MEGFRPAFERTFEFAEAVIEGRVDEFAAREEMSSDSMLSDFVTFAEIGEEAGGYFEEVSEKTAVPIAELIAYSKRISI